jgi:hypothetical protein
MGTAEMFTLAVVVCRMADSQSDEAVREKFGM